MFSDVEVVYEVKVSEELRQKALGLQLPPNFYSYLDREPCKGCVGCEPDSEVGNSFIVFYLHSSFPTPVFLKTHYNFLPPTLKVVQCALKKSKVNFLIFMNVGQCKKS